MPETLSLILEYMASFRSVVADGKVKHYIFMAQSHSPMLLSQMEGLWPFCSVELRENTLYAEYIVRPKELSEFLNCIIESGLFSKRRSHTLMLRFNNFAVNSGCHELVITCNVSSKRMIKELLTRYARLGDRVVQNTDTSEVFIDTSVGLNSAILERIGYLPDWTTTKGGI